ncbi:MFS transporter [Salmonella enterica subsp. enterica serovar Poona]|nr:MFS transporter [Salmonella enterica subsp. enterica serovar Poona]HCZ4969883.1 MFS transporter [Salmonella enterica subsp. enterica serovar Saintpaul str. CFSAN004160]
MSSVQERSWNDLLGGRNLFFSIALSGGVALHAINIYIATTVLPSVVNEIGGLELYSWNTTLFVVASILGSALTSRLLALMGARKAYLVAVMLFIAGSIVCALAQTMPVMLAGRALQGLGGGFLFALCYAMIYALFDEKLWPRAMALISGMWGVATLLGPAAGGIFAEMNAWRAAFGILVPVTLLYMLLVWLVFPAHKRAADLPVSKPPLMQLLLLVAAVMAVSTGGMSPDVAINVAGISVAVVLTLLLIRREFTSEIRLLPRDALRLNSPLLALYITMGLLIIGMTSETFIPYFLQILHGQTPLISGYLAALMAAGWTVSEIWSSGWQGRNIKRAIAAGPVLVLAGMMVLALSIPRSTGGDWIVLFLIGLGLTLVGFGIGLGWPHLLTRILQFAPADEQDAAATSITTVQLFATALGSAVAGMLANAGGLSMPGGQEGASSAAWLLFAAMAVAPLLSLMSAKKVISGLNK